MRQVPGQGVETHPRGTSLLRPRENGHIFTWGRGSQRPPPMAAIPWALPTTSGKVSGILADLRPHMGMDALDTGTDGSPCCPLRKQHNFPEHR